MKTVSSLSAAGRLLDRQMYEFARSASQIERQGETKAAGVVVSAVASNLGGRSIRMSGVGKKGANVGVVAAPVPDGVIVKMTGPAHLIERDTRAHLIIGSKVGRLGKGKGSRSKAAKQAAKQDLYDALFGGKGGGRLAIDGKVRTGPFKHPGTKGQYPFRDGVRTAQPAVPFVFHAETVRHMRKAFS